MAFGRKRDGDGSIDDERDRLRLQGVELDDLKHELSERIAAVRERESELRAVIANGNGTEPTHVPAGLLPAAGGPDAVALERRVAELTAREQTVAARERAIDDAEPGMTGESASERVTELDERTAELNRRAAELVAREAELERTRVQSPGERDADQLARIDARLAEVKEAEKMFLRTQQELATRSEAVAARERLVAQRERELEEHEGGWGAPDLGDVEARLRRLETRPSGAEQPPGFSGGFRKLQQEGTRPKP